MNQKYSGLLSLFFLLKLPTCCVLYEFSITWTYVTQLLGIKTTECKRTTFIVTPAKKDVISTSFPSQVGIGYSVTEQKGKSNTSEEILRMLILKAVSDSLALRESKAKLWGLKPALI